MIDSILQQLMLKQFLRESQQGPTARGAVDELPLASILRLLLHDSTRAQRDGCLRACRKEDDPVVTAGRPPVAGCHMGREKAAPGVEVPKLWAIARTRALGLWLSAIYRKSLTRCFAPSSWVSSIPRTKLLPFLREHVDRPVSLSVQVSV
jgi:hypothetical protein